MSMTRASLISLTLLALATLGFQSPAPLTAPSDPNSAGSDVAGRVNVGGNGGYFRLNYTAGNGVGWNDGGYTQFGGWLPFTEFGADTMLYGETRTFLTNDALVGGVYGLGARQYLTDYDRFVGGAIYYDHNYGGSSIGGFGQITTSIETIGNWWDARANAYFPTHDTVRPQTGSAGGATINDTPFYQGNRIFFAGQANFLEALQGGDFEAGVPLIPGGQWLRGYVGGYFYNSNSHKDIEGVRARLEAQLSDDLSVQGIVTDDRTFGTLVNLQVDIRLGGGRPIRAFPSLSTHERMYLPVQRNWRIATNTYRAPIKVVARDITDHHKLDVAWVDNSTTVAGNGSVEHPFQTLAQAEAAANVDYILVKHGNGAYDGGITLKDNQRLLGEGQEHLFDAYAAFGKVAMQGTFNLPGFTNDPTLTPTLTNAAGDIVTLANNNEVSSFILPDAGGHAIYGTGITDFNLNHLTVTNAALGGIVLNNASGTGVIAHSTIDGTQGDAIQIANVNAAALNLNIADLGSVTNNVTALSILADNSTIQASVDGYLASANQSGLDLKVANSGVLDASITNSSFNNSTSGDSVRLTAVDAGSLLAVDMQNTTASGGFGNGLVLDSSNQAQIDANVTNGDFSNSGLDGVRVLADNSTGNTLTMTGTPAANAGVDGLHAEITNNSDFTIGITNGSFANAGQNAIDTTVDGSSTLNLTIDPTPLDHAGSDGFKFQVADNSTFNVNLIDASLSFAGANGILGNIDNNSTVNMNLVRSTADHATQDGMQVTATNNSNFTANVEDGDFSHSGANGINLALSSGSHGVLNNVAGSLSSSDNGANGLLFSLQSGGTLSAALAGRNFSNNALSAINATVDGNLTSANLNLSNIMATNSGQDGFIFQAKNGADLTATGTGGSFSDSGNHGIRGIVQTGSSASLDFDGTTVANSGASGLYLDVSGGSAFSSVFTNGSFTNSGTNAASPDRNAVQITMDNSIGSLNLTNTAGDNNHQNGLLLTLQNGAKLGTTIANGNFNNSLVNAIQANVSGFGSQATLNMTNTTGNNAAGDDIRFNVSNSGQLIANATGGSFSNAGANGINGVLDNGGQAAFNFNNITVTNSKDDGLFVTSTNGSVFNGTFNNGSFANSGQDAASLHRDALELIVNASTNTLNMTNTAGNNAGSDGLHFEVENGGSLTGNVTSGSFANAGDNAVDGTVSGAGSQATVALSGTSGDNAGTTGVLLNADAAGELNFSFANSSISNAKDNGVQLNATGLNTQASLTLNNTAVNGNGLTAFTPRDGVNLNAAAGAEIDVNLQQGTINGNRDDGIRAEVAGAGSTISFTGSGANVDGNLRGDGLGFDVTAGGTLTGVFNAGTFANNGSLVAASGVRGNVNGLNSSADLTFNGTAVDNNKLDGFNISSLNTGSVNLRLNNGVSASNNGRYGIDFLIDGPNTVGNLLMTGNNIVSGNQAGGIFINASNGAQTTSAISGNVSNNGGFGVDVVGNNLTINSLTFTGKYDHNGAQGINIDLNNSIVNNFKIDTATVTNNGAEGVRIVAANGSQITNGLITNNTISNNNGDGILFSLVNSQATLFSIDNNLGINQNTGNGIQVALDNSPTSSFSITNNGGINNNTKNGILFNLTNSDLTDVLVDSNAIQGNAAAGLQFTTTTSNVSGAITDNVITRNTLSGIGITALGGAASTTIDFGNTALNHVISGNTISLNGNAGVGAGILADVRQNVHLIATLQDNTITQNQSFGVGITSTDGRVDLTVGGATGAVGNKFDQNVGEGLSLTLQNSSTGSVDIENNVITRTASSNAANPGNGINIHLRSTSILNPSTAQLTASVISNNVIGSASDPTLGNAGNGIVVTDEGNSLVNNLTLDHNMVANNGGDGIQFNKLGDANITNVTVSNSLLTANTGNGLNVVVSNGNQTTTFDIHDNTISSNLQNGVHLEAQADSGIDANLTNNTISSNTKNGILVEEQANDPTDQRDVTGIWIQNQITNNGANGISLTGAYGIASALVIGQTGFDALGNGKGNNIDNNGGWGISSNAVGVADISNNTITNNQAGGVQILALRPFGNTIDLDSNIISSNNGDGLQLQATGTAFLSVTATGNSIVNNNGRGVNVLNQVNATTELQFGDGTLAGGNLISNNLGEGFYVVNTSSANQSISAPASQALLADGALNVTPDMVLDLQFNTISNNGSPGSFPSAGLVLRVGTSNSAGFNLTGDGAAGVGNAGLAGNGRVNARVINNTFGGNFGSDVLVESFTSTVNPLTTVGTWDDTQFTIAANGLQRDPLARLNMVFYNNTGDALDVTRGQSDATVNGDPSTGAFYNNNESVFKSRIAIPGRLSNGPFTDGARRRNAQRLASSSPPYSIPGFPAGAAGFAYDGVGASTFRIESNFSTTGFTSGDTFVGDTGVVPPPTNANGVPFTNPLPGEELPYGWDTSVAPGTFQFLIP
jgi:hypothetical protein